MAMPHPELTLDFILPVEFDPAGLTQEYNALIDAAYTSQMGRDYQKAITYYTKAIESDPQVAGVYINRAAAYESIGDLERALQDLDEALTLESKPKAHHNRGNIYFIKGDYDRAIQNYDRALELEPGNAAAYNYRGHSYKHKSDYDSLVTRAFRVGSAA